MGIRHNGKGRQRHRLPLVMVLAALMVGSLLAACSSGQSIPPGMFSMYLGEPKNPLVPGNTTESEGNKVITALWTPLVTYDNRTKDLTYDGAARSVTSPDNIHWTIVLKPGWTFHDGTPVTAESYVRAWNYTALSTNAQGASYFFSNVVGYDQLQAPEDGGAPAATEMSGLRAVNPTTISVTLTEPFAIFPITLGYSAFDPLPDAFFRDPKAFGQKPIGNGPFQAQTAWVPGQGMTLRRYDQYRGPKAKSRGVVLRVYTELTTAYTDVLAGNLDILRDLPPDAYASAKDLFGDRYAEQPRPSVTNLGFPTYDKRYADPNVRKALSMAIDRAAIARAIFFDTRQPADSYAAPVINGYRAGACGRWCEYHPEEAQKMLRNAGFDFSTPIDLWFNAGAGHDVWMTAIGNMFRKIGLSYRLRGNLQFNEYLPKRDNKQMTGPFRDGWDMDYPSIYDFLSPLYSTAALAPAGSNTTFYSNSQFDDALAQGNRQTTIAAANAQYQKAEDILFESLPSAPLFYELHQTVWSKRVSAVHYDTVGDIDLAAVIVDGDPVS